MVKNTTGGNKSKSFASKSTNTSNRKTILATEYDDIYVCVKKLLGNGRFLTIDNTGKEYMAILRNKMKGRNKRNNLVSLFSLLLVKLQGFSEESNDVEIVSVYNDTDMHVLSKLNDVNISNLIYFHNNQVFSDQSKVPTEDIDRYEFDINYTEPNNVSNTKLPTGVQPKYSASNDMDLNVDFI